MVRNRTPRLRLAPLLAAAGFVLGASAASAGPERVAVFDFQFARGAPLPPTDDDNARLKRTSDQFRTLLKDSGKYEVVSTDAVQAEASGKDQRACGGCVEAMGKSAGAEGTFVGEVQKVSNLIINMNVYFKPTAEGGTEQAFSVDLRGDTDESFDRGIRYLVKNQLLERRH